MKVFCLVGGLVLGFILAGSDGPAFPWLNFGGIGLMGATAIFFGGEA